MIINFIKMHSLGNDFMVIDAITQSINIDPVQIIAWSHRYMGVGFDQLLVVEASNSKNIDFNYRIFNANGNEVGQCANGVRCLAWFLQYKKLTQKSSISVATKTTIMKLFFNDDQTITVDMGLPQWDPKNIPIIFDKRADKYSISYVGEQDKLLHNITLHAVSVGNPHAIILVDDVDKISRKYLGKIISQHSAFPSQANVSFMKILNNHHIKLRVYERDCGETLACGSAAVASVAVGRRFYDLSTNVRVSFIYGDVFVNWSNFDESIFLTGSVNLVYEGTLCVL